MFIEMVTKLSYFDAWGRLTPAGRVQLWGEVDDQMSRHEKDGLEFFPSVSSKQLATLRPRQPNYSDGQTSQRSRNNKLHTTSYHHNSFHFDSHRHNSHYHDRRHHHNCLDSRSHCSWKY